MEFYKKQRKLLNNIGRYSKDSLRNNLEQLGKIASKGTYNSIDYRIKFSERLSSMEVFADNAISFIDGGRGAGKKQPPSDAIEKWIGDANIPTFYLDNGKAIPLKVQAFLIGRKIARDGIEPTNIISNTFSDKVFINKINKQVTKSSLEDIKTSFRIVLKEL